MTAEMRLVVTPAHAGVQGQGQTDPLPEQNLFKLFVEDAGRGLLA